MKIERGYPTYTVTPKAENAIVKGHPWVYDAEILNIEGETANGGLVDVISRKGRYLGTGFLSQQSKIRVRLISRNANDRFDEAFWRRKLQWAWDYRKSVMDPADLDACRVIFGEADAFPGLTVDKFHDLLSVQVLSVGMEGLQDLLLPALVDILRQDGQPIRGVFLRNDVALRDKAGLPQGKGWYALPGETPPDSPVVEIVENGVKYLVDVENGQKTGFFLDQKYNRRAVGRLAAGNPLPASWRRVSGMLEVAALRWAVWIYPPSIRKRCSLIMQWFSRTWCYSVIRSWKISGLVVAGRLTKRCCTQRVRRSAMILCSGCRMAIIRSSVKTARRFLAVSVRGFQSRVRCSRMHRWCFWMKRQRASM